MLRRQGIEYPGVIYHMVSRGNYPKGRTKGSRLEGDDRQATAPETTAKNPWIAARLHMGHPNYVSNLVNGE